MINQQENKATCGSYEYAQAVRAALSGIGPNQKVPIVTPINIALIERILIYIQNHDH